MEEETGWLIERKGNGRPEWWNGSASNGRGEFTIASLAAVRFARADDAQWVINRALHLDQELAATEHAWVPNSTRPIAQVSTE